MTPYRSQNNSANRKYALSVSVKKNHRLRILRADKKAARFEAKNEIRRVRNDS